MQWKLPVGPVRSLTQWLESAGIIVLVEEAETPRVDAMSQWQGHPVMLVNGRLPMDRRRFTMAHELGHLTLHSNVLGDDVEAEAFEAQGFTAEDIAAVTGYAADRDDHPFRLRQRPLRAV